MHVCGWDCSLRIPESPTNRLLVLVMGCTGVRKATEERLAGLHSTGPRNLEIEYRIDFANITEMMDWLSSIA